MHTFCISTIHAPACINIIKTSCEVMKIFVIRPFLLHYSPKDPSVKELAGLEIKSFKILHENFTNIKKSSNKSSEQIVY